MSEAPGSFPPAISSQDAWAKLPPATKGQDAELPLWARQLADAMPRTTASLLVLDYAQRSQSPIPAKIRSSMRLVSAVTNRSSSAIAQAKLDLSLAGAPPQEIEALSCERFSDQSNDDRAALEFARQMSVNSDAVTGSEFLVLADHFGEKIAASMVLLMAYSNFQDRLLICLGAREGAEPTPPLEIEFPPEAFVAQTTPPPPKPNNASATQKETVVPPHPGWSAQSFDFLQDRLETQRQKPTRLPIPDWQTCAKNLPPGLIPRESDIIWYRIVFGYAPELAVPFEYFMRTSGAEAAGKWDRIFATSLFWVTTKAVECPYCMGHCEMNFEVAGLTKQEIADRSRILAGDDWSSFPRREQRAFAFARKLSLTPNKIAKPDIDQLRQDFGDEAALIIILNACRYHYMTRISNGFQLTLERENVFFNYYNVNR